MVDFSADTIDSLAAAAQEYASTGVALVPLKPAGEARFDPNGLYRLVGFDGLWRAERIAGRDRRVLLSQLFSDEKLVVDGVGWRDGCESGRIRQVG